MSRRHPIISITGSSGAGTTSVKRTFENIFRRENVKAAYVEGDAFHRYDRAEMRKKLFRDYSETGTGTTRHYVHDEDEQRQYNAPPGTFTQWEQLPENSDLLFY